MCTVKIHSLRDLSVHKFCATYDNFNFEWGKKLKKKSDEQWTSNAIAFIAYLNRWHVE